GEVGDVVASVVSEGLYGLGGGLVLGEPRLWDLVAEGAVEAIAGPERLARDRVVVEDSPVGDDIFDAEKKDPRRRRACVIAAQDVEPVLELGAESCNRRASAEVVLTDLNGDVVSAELQCLARLGSKVSHRHVSVRRQVDRPNRTTVLPDRPQSQQMALDSGVRPSRPGVG